jgi:hypothetical protein
MHLCPTLINAARHGDDGVELYAKLDVAVLAQPR